MLCSHVLGGLHTFTQCQDVNHGMLKATQTNKVANKMRTNVDVTAAPGSFGTSF